MPDDSKKDSAVTVHLPKTEFPMQAGLAEREPRQAEAWEAKAAYAKLRAASQGRR
jgi:isoleucyl-tRNA synthetase